jgi:glycosyltransferase involved in cell wall biosynthesis
VSPALLHRVRAKVRLLPGARRAAKLNRRQRQLRRILASRVFDQAWYELQAGRSFGSVRDALKDYLDRGRQAGRSPSPLFEPQWYDREQWRSRATDPLARYLGRPVHRRTRQPQLLFDPEAYLARFPDTGGHLGGPLGHFLSTATPDSVLTLDQVFDRPATVTWGRLREHLEQAVTAYQAQERLRLAPRRTDRFDVDRQRQFLARLDGVRPQGTTTGTPLVSIVMPVWNRAAAVRRAVESVQAQTFGDWELVVVDDGSTDDTPAVLEGLATFERRLRVIRTSRSGVSAARNTAIEQARGEYLAFLDSDNTWEPDFLRVMLAVMQRDGLTGAYAAMRLEQGERTTYRGFDGGREFLLVGNHIDLNVLVVATEEVRAVGGFTPELRRTVDYDLVLKLTRRAPLTYLPFIGAVYSEDGEDSSRISVRESLSWDYVVRARHLIDWVQAADAVREPGRVSVVMAVRDDAWLARRCVTRLLADADAGGIDLELVIVDNGSSRGATVTLASLGLADPRITVLRNPVDLKWALGVDTGLVRTTGEVVVVCDPAAIVAPGLLAALRDALARPEVASVQPVSTGPDGTVEGAGVTFTPAGSLPAPLLRGYPIEDVRALGEQVELPALDGPVWAARAADLIAEHGLDCLFMESWQETDLSLRLARAGRGSALLLTGHEVMLLPPGDRQQAGRTRDDELFRGRWSAQQVDGKRLWEGSGLSVAHWWVDRDEKLGRRRVRPVVVRRPHLVTEGPATGQPCLRWAIKIAAPAGPAGRGWGDWHFAQSLAQALRRLGQDVAVDVREAHHRRTGDVDDVQLVLRGLDQVDPDEVRTRLLWVISHPDLVTPEEMQGYDQVLAASLSWARAVDKQHGIAVEPMLQCTDPALFTPDAADPDTGAPVLFVGNSRDVYRQAVRYGVEAGVDLHLYGQGWEPFVPEQLIRARSIPQSALPAAYASAGVVLNDHWDDMRLEGFISNRVFDVLAVAGRLATDDVAGLDELFGGQVRAWRDPSELVELLHGEPQDLFPDREQRLGLARLVRREHSFDARARRLLELAAQCRES